MKRFWFLTAVLTAAVVVSGLLVLPTARLPLVRSQDDGTIPGVIHVHTNRSDGRSSPEEVARAAARAGLTFIVFTDHGDATRSPDRPVYRHGVLCIDGVEISTTGGHYVALGLPQAPYPLGGEARDVVEDVRRLGGFGVAAHPDSPKPDLQWHDWNAPFDGVELVNPDTGWRKRLEAPGLRSKLSLLGSLVSYPFRPSETIASAAAPSLEGLERWEGLAERRRVVGLAGADAHAKLALKDSDPGDNSLSVPFPSYEATFRTLSVHVKPRAALSGNADADANAVLEGIREGHLYLALDGIASPPVFSFTAETGTKTVEEGDEIEDTGGPLTLLVRSNAPGAFTTVVLDGGRPVASANEAALSVPVTGPGVYRVEIHAPDRTGAPAWIISNPIYVRRAQALSAQPAAVAARSSVPIFDGQNDRDWGVEHDAGSSGAMTRVTVGGQGTLMFTYTLSRPASAASRPVVAVLRHLSDGLGGNDRLVFAARADRPMRVSVQLRNGVPGTPADRWQRSVYLDAREREVVVSFNDMTPMGETRTRTPALDVIRYVMFVVDPTNTTPGSSGTIWFRRIALER